MIFTLKTADAPSFLDQAVQVATITQAMVTALALIVGGWWTYRRFVRKLEDYAHIETSAEIEVIGRHGDNWIVEVRAVLSNKGQVENKIAGLSFDLVALNHDDPLTRDPELWNGQVSFPHSIAEGTFLRADLRFFSLGPGITAKYSHVTSVSTKAAFLMLHCWFDYIDGRNLHHSMERTVRLPNPAAEVPCVGEETPFPDQPHKSASSANGGSE